MRPKKARRLHHVSFRALDNSSGPWCAVVVAARSRIRQFGSSEAVCPLRAALRLLVLNSRWQNRRQLGGYWTTGEARGMINQLQTVSPPATKTLPSGNSVAECREAGT